MTTRPGATDEGFWGDADGDAALERFRTLVDTIDDAVFQLDGDGTVVAANDAVAEATGYARDDLLGEHVARLLDGDDADRLERAVASYDPATDDDLAPLEVDVETAAGESVPWELRLSPLVEDGTTRGTIGVARDRSSRTRRSDATESTYTPPRSMADVLDQANIGVFVLDESLEVRWIDETIEEYLGVDHGAVVGRKKPELIEDTLKDRFADPESFAETVLATYDDNSFVERFVCHVTGEEDGLEERWLEHQSKPIESGPYAGGRIEFYYDVTDRKRSKGALRESREEFRSLVDVVEEYAIFRLDTEGRVISWNEGASRIKGYDREEIVGDHFSTFYTRSDREAGVPEENLEIATREGSVEDEGWRVRQDGTQFWANVTITAIRDDDGTHQGYLKVTRDMTDRRERERELESELERVFSRVSDAFYAVDEEFRFTHVNDRAEELLGRDEDDLLGERLWDVFPSAGEIDEVWDAFQTAWETQEATSYEVYYDELGFWVEANLYPSQTGISVYFDDVSDRKERERKLAESERRYRTLAESFPNGIVTLFDEDLEYTLATGQAFDDLPIDPTDLEGEHATDVWGDDVLDALGPDVDAVFDGEERSTELEYAGEDWIVHTVPVTDESGAVVAGLSMVQQITEQKERERYLRDAKAQLEAATEAGAVGTWEWNVPADEFVAGSSFARTFGVDPDDARDGVSLDRLLASIHEADRDRVSTSIEEAVERCGEYEEEYRVWNAEGELRWVVARGHVECDGDGNPTTFPGALADITERKRAELEVERQTRQLETLFEVLPVGVVVSEQDGTLIRANDTAKEIWGGDVFDASSVAEYEKYDATWAETGEPVEPDEWTMSEVLRGNEVSDPNVYEIETFDDERRIIMEHGMPVRDAAGDVSRAVVTLTDITERREYQRRLEETIDKLEASNERLEQFAYAASHDLQEPLRMVSSYLQLIERRYRDDLDEEGTEFLAYAVDGADRMRAMIDGLLAYSRVESRGDPLEPVDLDTVLADVLEDLSLQIEETDADVTSDDLPRVMGDASQLRQVLQNLIDNALTYHGDEPPRVHVGVERRGREWVISVADEGIGIDAEDQDRVFSVFDRLHTSDEYEGTGIGLALCRRIVERHGGDIWIDSERGEGSTFSFTLPAA